jgi:Cu(I)/Ag(I) efflux system membrane fusion protein
VGADPAGHGSAGPGRNQNKKLDRTITIPENVMTLSPERLQAIGVKFELAKRVPWTDWIRTVGQVEIDERRLAHVNISWRVDRRALRELQGNV